MVDPAGVGPVDPAQHGARVECGAGGGYPNQGANEDTVLGGAGVHIAASLAVDGVDADECAAAVGGDQARRPIVDHPGGAPPAAGGSGERISEVAGPGGGVVAPHAGRVDRAGGDLL